MAIYEGSYAGLGEMIRSGFMEAEMRARAERVAALARAIAPVYKGPDDPHRGRYKESFVVSSTSRGGWRKNRAAGIVTSTDPDALEIEFGTSKELGHHTLRKALAAATD
jgi:hypothetical protein